jgi:DNA invertase Pin-like site-specific DNA recombinase
MAVWARLHEANRNCRTQKAPYATAHDIKIVRVFREEGVSGSVENMNRPAWQELMTILHSNGVRTIIIEKLDRLARDLMVQETAIADLRRNGFALVSVAEPDLMASDPTRVLMRQLMGAVAQYDKSQIVAKLRGARMRMKAAEGRCEGTKPYGFREGEDAVIERMKALRASGMGFDKIAAQMNSEGLKPRRGDRWHGLTVNRVLTGKGRSV